MSLFLLSFGLTVSYQNCGKNDVEFSTLDSIQANGKPDFKVTYTQELDVGNLGHFSATSDDHVLEEVVWDFDDGQNMAGATSIRQFDHVGQVTFSVRGKFAGDDEWIVKNNLVVNVIDPTSNTCLDLNNLKILSDQLDLNQPMPEWDLRDGRLRVRLNFNSPCLAVALYSTHWVVSTTTVKRTIIYEFDGNVADIPFSEIGEYEIAAEVTYAHDPDVHYVSKVIKVVTDDVLCKPAEGIGADKDLDHLVVGDMVTFNAMIPRCLGFTGEINWYIDNAPVSDQLSLEYLFQEARDDIQIRADAPRVVDGKLTMQQYFLRAHVTNGFQVGCDLRCNGTPDGSELPNGLRCENSQGQPAAAVNCDGLDTTGISCPTVCEDDPEETYSITCDFRCEGKDESSMYIDKMCVNSKSEPVNASYCSDIPKPIMACNQIVSCDGTGGSSDK